MPRTRQTTRCLCRRVIVRTWRVPHRASLRNLPGYECGPSELSQALSAFNRVLRCNRRLAKLAPRFFDPVVVDREAREREEQRRWQIEVDEMLVKVYGPAPASEKPDATADLAPPPSPRIQRVIERELADRECWLAVGMISWRRYHERRPHDVPSLGQVVRLLWVAVQFGRWAAGMSDKPPEPSLPKTDLEADLRRAYGPRDSAATPAANTPGAPSSSSAASSHGGVSIPAIHLPPDSGNDSLLRFGEKVAAGRMRCGAPSSSNSAEGEVSNCVPTNNLKPDTLPLKPETPSPPLSPSRPASVRRDAWSSWARHMRRRP